MNSLEELNKMLKNGDLTEEQHQEKKAAYGKKLAKYLKMYLDGNISVDDLHSVLCK